MLPPQLHTRVQSTRKRWENASNSALARSLRRSPTQIGKKTQEKGNNSQLLARMHRPVASTAQHNARMGTWPRWVCSIAQHAHKRPAQVGGPSPRTIFCHSVARFFGRSSIGQCTHPLHANRWLHAFYVMIGQLGASASLIRLILSNLSMIFDVIKSD